MYPLTSLSQALTGHIRMAHVNLDPGQCPSHFVQFALCLCSRFVDNFHTLFFQLVPFLLKLFALVLGLRMLHTQMETLILHSFTLSLQALEQVLHAHACAAQELTSPLDNTLVEAQAIGNCQRITPTWQTNAQSIGRRERFDVKFDRGVDHSGL